MKSKLPYSRTTNLSTHAEIEAQLIEAQLFKSTKHVLKYQQLRAKSESVSSQGRKEFNKLLDKLYAFTTVRAGPNVNDNVHTADG